MKDKYKITNKNRLWAIKLIFILCCNNNYLFKYVE